MLVLFHLFLALVVVYACGIGIVGVLHSLFGKRGQLVGVGVIAPVVGYALSLIAFSFSYDRLMISHSAVVIVGLVAADLALLCLVLAKFGPERWRFSLASLIPLKSDRLLLIPLVAIVALSSWAYVAMGEGHYYHSGNEDFFDAINGGQAYAENTPLISLSPDFKTDIRLQYSSQAFWRVVLGVGGMDAFALQSILDLLLTAISLYWLVRYVFDGSPRLSAFLAFCCVAANFYFTTFLAGHVGSMMYLAVAPVLLGVTLAWGQRKLKAGWLLLAPLFYGFISITYPGPFDFLLIPLVFWLVHKRLFEPWNLWQRIGEQVGVILTPEKRFYIQWRRLWKLGILVLLIAAGGIGLLASARSFIQDLDLYQRLVLRTNVTWRIAFEKEIWVILWGLIPSNLVGSVSFLPFFVTDPRLGDAMFAASMIISVLALVAAWSHRLKQERQFLFLLVFLYPAYYVMMVKAWGSPYYAYKFLYTNFFVVVIALGMWVAARVSSASRLTKILSLTSVICLVVVNIFWDVSRSVNILDRPYHQKKKIAEFLAHIGEGALASYALDVPDETNTLVFARIIAHRQQLRSKAENLIQLENLKTVAYTTLRKDSLLYDNDLLRLIKRPATDDILISSKYGTDHFWPWRISWVGNEVTDLSVSFGQTIREVLDFIKNSGIADRTYLDMRTPNLYALIVRALLTENMSLQVDPTKSIFFLRQKLNRFTYERNIRTQTVYEVTDQERVLFENRLFQVVEVPLNRRKLLPPISEEVDNTNLYLVAQIIRKRGNQVYLDMPPYELTTLYTREFLRSIGVNVVDEPNVTTFLRLAVPPGLERYYYRSMMNPREVELWRGRWTSRITMITVTMQVVDVPLEGRVKMGTSDLDLVRYWYLTLPGNATYDFEVSLMDLSPNARFLRLVVAPGPGIDFSEFIFLLRGSDERILKRWHVSGASTCVDLALTDPVLNSRSLSVLNFEGENLIGHSLLPADERLLNYGLLAVELTDSTNKYSDQMLAALNPRVRLQYNFIESKLASSRKYDEIIDDDSKANLWLGTGWYTVETENSRPFRWVNNDAQFVVQNPSSTTRYLNFEVEQGPSLAGKEPTMEVIQDAKMIDHFALSGNCKRKVQLNKASADQSLIVLRVDKPGNRIKEDPRILDFRVFRAYLSEN